MHVSRELGEPPSPRTPRSGRLRFSISALFERQQVSHNLFTSSFLVEFYFFSRANAEIELSSPFSANLHGYKVLANRQLPGRFLIAGSVSVTTFKIDQNINQNRSIDKVQQFFLRKICGETFYPSL